MSPLAKQSHRNVVHRLDPRRIEIQFGKGLIAVGQDAPVPTLCGIEIPLVSLPPRQKILRGDAPFWHAVRSARGHRLCRSCTRSRS